MPSVSQTNVPQGLNLDKFRSAMNQGDQVARSCRFVAVIEPPTGIKNKMPDDLHLMCEAAELPGRGFDVVQTRYYGPGMVFPNNTMYNTANFQFICRNKSEERYFFDEWMNFINPTETFNFAYPKDYWSRIQIYQLSEIGVGTPNTKMDATSKLSQKSSYRWVLNYAWPTLVNPQQVTWADQDVLRLQVTFAYKYWDRPDVK